MNRTLQIAEREYKHARGWLADLLTDTDAERFNRARRLTEDARMEYEVARLELEKHMKTAHVQRVYG